MPATPIQPALDIASLTLGYDNQCLYSGLSLTLAPGEKVALTGRSGGGKSSLLHCILGFCQPSAGSIRVEGVELTARAVWQIRQRIAFVAQEARPGSGTVGEVVAHPFQLKANRHRALDAGRLDAWLDRFELPRAILAKQLDDLSGGEKQRVCLIIAALLERPIWLLDEPTSALDRASKAILGRWLADRPDLTVLMVTHDPELLPAAGRCVELADLVRGVPA